jgi:hypothetical protein
MAELTSEESHARVTVGYAFTVNLGNFENVKVHVEVTDAPRKGETVKAAYDRIEKFVSDRVEEQIAEAREVAQ